MILKALAAVGAAGIVVTGLALTTKPHTAEVRVMQTTEQETLVYPSLMDAAILTNIPEDDILRAIRTGDPIDSTYFALIR